MWTWRRMTQVVSHHSWRQEVTVAMASCHDRPACREVMTHLSNQETVRPVHPMHLE